MLFDGIRYDERTDGTISVTLVATGISTSARAMPSNIESIVVPKPSATASVIQSRIKETVSRDANLPTLDVNDDVFEIPTYLRRQAD